MVHKFLVLKILMELLHILFFGSVPYALYLQYLTDPDDATSPWEFPMAGTHPDILPR
jgi:hypothetical protein